MKAILVRIGVDHSYGGWNAPVDPISNEFIYVPIPEKDGTPFHPDCERKFAETSAYLHGFAGKNNLDLHNDLRCPPELLSRSMHLDPDFEFLTYGDVGSRRGSEIRELADGDLLVFYAGLRPIRPCDHKLVYALVGLFVVGEVIEAASVPQEKWHQNAHTRKVKRGATDIVVRAKPALSGRLQRCIPIGEFRDRAYRVRNEILEAWGGLSVSDGYIQRSARPPRFLDAARFYNWFNQQQVPVIAANYTGIDQRVILVQLRQPKKSNKDEMRSDPFWEFGSFGCTGCHRKNLMNPKRIDEVAGARLGFAQGGPDGIKLVMLTPPVEVVKHIDRCEVKWKPVSMPFRYANAPLLIDREGNSDFSTLPSFIERTARSTWTEKFTSRFRSRRAELRGGIADELCHCFDQMRQAASELVISTSYADALPYPPNKIDPVRSVTYQQLLKNANRATTCQRRSGKRLTDQRKH